jgi:hypothetical protein
MASSDWSQILYRYVPFVVDRADPRHPRQYTWSDRVLVLLAYLGNAIPRDRLFEMRGWPKSSAKLAMLQASEAIVALTGTAANPVEWNTSTEADRLRLSREFQGYVLRLRERRAQGTVRRLPHLRRDVVALSGVLGAIDGSLIRIRRPSVRALAASESRSNVYGGVGQDVR